MIRLQRVGRKHEPTFRVVLTDSRNSTKSGKFLQVLGNYDPRSKGEFKIDAEQAKHWISKGAQVSDTLHNLLIDKKIIQGKKINVLPRKSPIKKEGAEGENKKVETPAPTEASAEAKVATKESAPTETK